MGQLLTTLTFRGGDLLAPGLDIENAKPSLEETQLYDELHSTLVSPGPAMLDALRSYTSASEHIRTAITSPTQENENKAMDAVLPVVGMLREFYAYSLELQKGVPRLLNVLCQGDVGQNLERYQGLTKLFADILDLVFEFDYLKMRSPTLQNDFSYYRRIVDRGRYSGEGNPHIPSKDGVSDLRSQMTEADLANRISFFIAYPMPLLKCVIDASTDFVTKHGLQKSVCDCLAAMWAACFQTANKRSNLRPVTVAFCLKVMVVSIILYDHIHPNGAFSKGSPINIKNSVKVIQTVNVNVYNIPEESSASNLISALRYNSKHLNDDTTPKGIKNMVMAV